MSEFEKVLVKFAEQRANTWRMFAVTVVLFVLVGLSWLLNLPQQLIITLISFAVLFSGATLLLVARTLRSINVQHLRSEIRNAETAQARHLDKDLLKQQHLATLLLRLLNAALPLHASQPVWAVLIDHIVAGDWFSLWSLCNLSESNKTKLVLSLRAAIRKADADFVARQPPRSHTETTDDYIRWDKELRAHNDRKIALLNLIEALSEPIT